MAGHTPGPWGWFGNANSNSLYLATTHSGRRYVMGFTPAASQTLQSEAVPPCVPDVEAVRDQQGEGAALRASILRAGDDA